MHEQNAGTLSPQCQRRTASYAPCIQATDSCVRREQARSGHKDHAKDTKHEAKKNVNWFGQKVDDNSHKVRPGCPERHP